MPNADCRNHPLRRLAYGLLLAVGAALAIADERPLRVAVIDNSPPMSYENANGQLVGFNIELAEALCESMRARCTLKRMPIGDVVDSVAGGEVDFAAVSLLVTPERQRRVIFSKPYYRSMSVWLARPGLAPGSAGTTVAAVRGSAQARHIETQGWKSLFVEHHRELPALLASGGADAAIVPMPTSLQLMQDRQLQEAHIKPTILPDPLLGGDVAFSISPQRADLRARIDAAIDQVKNDGRFDRINTKYLPFRLQ
jgi:ABC-type amino acid transport substrate-binding protein